MYIYIFLGAANLALDKAWQKPVIEGATSCLRFIMWQHDSSMIQLGTMRDGMLENE